MEGIEKAEKELLKTANKNIFDKGGIKFAGKTLVSGEALSKPAKATKKIIEKSDTVTNVFEGLGKIKKSIGKAFYRDYGLPKQFVKQKQKYLDLYSKDADDIVETLTDVFKGTNTKERELISFAIEGGDTTTLSPKLQIMAEQARDIFNDIAKIESERGLLNTTLDDYVTHIYKDKKKAKQVLDYIRTGVQGDKTKFAKERLIPTIEEAEKLGLKPEKDIAKVLAARLMASQKAIREQNLLRQVADKFGQPKIVGDKVNPKMLDNDLVEYTNKELKGLVIPRAIAEDLAKVGKQTINNEELNMFLRGFDVVQNFFKGSVTSLFPAFHGRNFISNVAQNALDIGVKSIDPVFNLKSLNILRKGSKGTFKTKLGKVYSYDELRKLMKEYNILGSPGVRDVTENVGQRLAKGLSKARQANPFSIGRSVGTGIENHARTMNFLANLKRGLSPEDAAKRTKQFLFDYQNLSDFEKTILRRAIPFYTWTRKNIELQAKTLAKRPGIIAAELKSQRLGQGESQQERQALPEWLSEGLAVRLSKKNGLVNYLYGLGLPIENFFQNLPQGVSKDEMVDYLNKLASQSSFVPKYITELATNHDFFRDKPLKEVYNATEFASFPQFVKDFLEIKEREVDYVDDNGKRVKYTIYVANPYKLHLLRSLPTSRLSGTIGGLTDENQTTVGKLLKYTTGIKIYPIDVAKMEEKELKDYINEVEGTLVNYGVLRSFTNVYQPKEKTKKSIFTK